MKIAYITAGAGSMVCGSCIQDNALAGALQKRGHDALLMPIYTPLRTDEESVASTKVFYGAISIYLEQKVPWFRYLPQAAHGWLARPSLLRRIAASSSAVNAKSLGELTVSMLKGEEGRQARDLQELEDWLATEFQPEIVHLTNSMLLGMAPRLKSRLGVPVVCSLQGEDIFLQDLQPEYRERAHQILQQRAREVDRLVSTSDYYARHMAEYLDVPLEQISVARIGINLDGHGSDNRPLRPRPSGAPLVVGFLARICPEKGLHDLLSAFRILCERAPEADLRLRVAGYLGGRDRKYLKEQLRRVSEWGLENRFEYLGEVSRSEKIAFLGGLDVLSVPTVYEEPKGLFVLEALANAVPVVLPAHGAFPELIEDLGGGLLVEPGSHEALADGLETLLLDPERREVLGRRGQDTVREKFTADALAARTETIYQELLSDGGQRGASLSTS